MHTSLACFLFFSFFSLGLALSTLQEDKLFLRDINRRVEDWQRGKRQFPSVENVESEDYITDMVKAIMDCPAAPIPGAAVGFFKDGEWLYKNAFGYKDATKKEQVNTDTLFGIGSCTKAFTSALSGMAVDQGKLTWSDSIHENFLPDFKIYGDIGNAVNLADLLSHRTGVPRNDYIWVVRDITNRSELVSALKYLPANYEFRTSFEYNNHMFVAAGYLAGLKLGGTWEEKVQTMIFNPLNMKNTTTDVLKAISSGNYAFPTGVNNAGKLVNYPPDVNTIIDVVCPAGCISSNLDDMKNWLQFMIDGGVTQNGKTLLSKESFTWITSPHTAMPITVEMYMPEPTFPKSFFGSYYTQGWWLGSYRGRPFMFHAGNTIGHSAFVGYLPLDKIGYVILTNIDGIGLPMLEVALVGLDVALGETPWLPTKYSCTFPCPYSPGCTSAPENSGFKVSEKQVQQASRKRVVDLSEYTGSYQHPSYGVVVISTNSSSNGSLFMKIGDVTGSGELDPDKEDRFNIIYTAPLYLDPQTVILQFGRNLGTGKVDSVTIPFNDPAVVFTNQNFTPKTSGYPKYRPSALA
eukprot:CAMPEP_0174251506 /NCGR_PEP_ID=MMETSP0439-20130205/1308_1 /TAXON_ID=0 /ORGANISM="Stereomyxa ramosa, Strain Chinc5" /LENGTH=575 /DNA_ID=CAMNT_0015331835 /DNA_START=15 /DNA_END=1742 /DNA_ORIENTATION=+